MNPDPPTDPIREAGFPTVEQLRRGIILNCIARSFWLVARKAIAEMEWDGDTYVEDTREGERWAVSFSEGGAVAVFYSTESSRNPFPDGSPPYDQSWYFRGMPRHLEPARDRALSKMHDFEFRCRNPARAVITAAMWSHGDRFTAVESWAEVYHHSLWACRTHLLPPDEALQEWWQGMGFPDALKTEAWSLYQRRIASTAPQVSVEPREFQTFVEIAGGDLNRVGYAEGILADVGITLEYSEQHQTG